MMTPPGALPERAANRQFRGIGVASRPLVRVARLFERPDQTARGALTDAERVRCERAGRNVI